MNLRDFLTSRRKAGETTIEWAKRNGFHPISLTLVANGHRKAGPDMAKKISAATGGVVGLSELRPDLWA